MVIAIVIGVIILVVVIFLMQSNNPFKGINQAGRSLNRTSRKTKKSCRRVCDDLADSSTGSYQQRKMLKNECMARCQSERQEIFIDEIQTTLG